MDLKASMFFSQYRKNVYFKFLQVFGPENDDTLHK